MPIKSMTGFGRGEVQRGNRVWTAELRCVNNRFLELKIKLPKGYSALEDNIRKLVSRYLQRGRIDLAVNVSGDFSDLVKVNINIELAKSYKNALVQLGHELSISDAVDLSYLASLPDVLVREQENEDLDSVWSVLSQAIEESLVQCEKMRQQEGLALLTDLLERLASFSSVIDQVAAAIPELLVQRKALLQERLEKLLGTVQIDPQRLSQEVVVLADKTDVTEEIVRLRSHMQQFRSSLAENGVVGRKLDFLIQEFLREVNTLASKINDAHIAHLTVELKSELEKMREQIQNIE
ncbi:MAG: YicC family protein [Desulfocapsaceae bacterium]|nr:YicC family protein [Desulfocapsaceae bacterium]